MKILNLILLFLVLYNTNNSFSQDTSMNESVLTFEDENKIFRKHFYKGTGLFLSGIVIGGFAYSRSLNEPYKDFFLFYLIGGVISVVGFALAIESFVHKFRARKLQHNDGILSPPQIE